MATVGAMRAILSVNSTAFRAGMGKGRASLLSFSAASNMTCASVLRLGMAVTSVIGPFMGLYGAVRAMRVAEAFEQEMNSSLAIVDDVSVKIRKRMEQVAFEVAYSTKFSMKEAAQAYFHLESAGMDLEQAMAALPLTARFAQAGMFDLARATELASKSQAAMGLRMKDPIANLVQLTRVTDVLVKANKLAGATTEQFGDALLTDAANAGRMAGQSIEEVVSVLALFAERGIVGEKAGSAYARAISYLSVQALDNAAAFDRAGVAMFDAQDKTRSLVDVIIDLENRFGSMSDKAREAELQQLGFTKKTLNLIKALVGGTAAMKDFQAQLDAAAGTTYEVSGKQLTDFAEAWEKIKAVMTRWSVETLTPIMQDLGSGVSLLLDAAETMRAASGTLAEAEPNFRTFSNELEGMEQAVTNVTKVFETWDAMLKVVIATLKTLGTGFMIWSQRLEMAASGIAAISGTWKEKKDFLSTLLEYDPNPDPGGGREARERATEALDSIGSTGHAMMEQKSKRANERYAEGIAKEQAATRLAYQTGWEKAGLPEGGDFMFPGLDFAMGGSMRLGEGGAGAGDDGAAKDLLADIEGLPAAMMSKASSIFAQMQTPLEKFQQTMIQLKSLFDSGAFDDLGGLETYRRAGEAATAAWRKAEGIETPAEKFGKQMKETRSIFEATRTPLEQFNKRLEDLQSLFDAGAFAGQGGEETYRRAVEQAQKAYAATSGEQPGKETGFARAGTQEAYDLIRQNRMGKDVGASPIVEELRQSNQALTDIDAGVDEIVDGIRRQADALRGEDLDV